MVYVQWVIVYLIAFKNDGRGLECIKIIQRLMKASISLSFSKSYGMGDSLSVPLLY